MKIFLENFKNNQGINQIYKIISGEFEYINNISEYDIGLLLHSRLFYFENIEFIETVLYKDGKSIHSNRQNVMDIDVKIDDLKKKRDVALKKSIIFAMNKEYDIPWGILTGIRPTKIVHKLLDENYKIEEIKIILEKEYLLRKDKIELLLGVCDKQRMYLKQVEGKYSIYIGIPFCPSKCLYCSFPSLQINEHKNIIDDYIDTVIYELKKTKEIMISKKINTIYIGGGTPTSLDYLDLEKIILACRDIFGEIDEFTIEAGRPDTLNYNYLKMFKDNNIDRISINPQTMNDVTLKKIGRNHDGAAIKEIFNMAKELGLENINMDLIVGLPDEGYNEVEATMKEIYMLNPNNITVHSLALKTGSRFYNVFKEYNIIKDKEAEEISDLINIYMKKMNLEPYYLYRQKNIVGNLENIGYSRNNEYCKYNISMMEERETVIGIGVGSVSKIVKGKYIKRIPNFKSLEDYIDRIDNLIEKKNRYINGDIL